MGGPAVDQKRIIAAFNLVVNHDMTVRDAADMLGVSKSTVHRDLTVLLKSMDSSKYQQVKDTMNRHLKNRQVNGGEAVRQGYLSGRLTRKGYTVMVNF